MEKKKLNDKSLENVSGGYIFLNDKVQYEIIDANGDVIDTARTWDEAVKKADKHNVSSQFIVWDELKDIREKSKK